MKKDYDYPITIADYIYNQHGSEVSDDKIIEIAKKLGKKPKVLLKKYKFVIMVHDALKSLPIHQ